MSLSGPVGLDRSLLRSRAVHFDRRSGRHLLRVRTARELRLPATTSSCGIDSPWAVPVLNSAASPCGIWVDGRRLCQPHGRHAAPSRPAVRPIHPVHTNHGFSTVVSLFSAERRHWLARRGLEQAVQTIARLMTDKHRVVRWSAICSAHAVVAGCPVRLDDPARVLSLCRAMLKARRTRSSVSRRHPANTAVPPRCFLRRSRVKPWHSLSPTCKAARYRRLGTVHRRRADRSFLCRRTITGDAEPRWPPHGEMNGERGIQPQPAVPVWSTTTRPRMPAREPTHAPRT